MGVIFLTWRSSAPTPFGHEECAGCFPEISQNNNIKHRKIFSITSCENFKRLHGAPMLSSSTVWTSLRFANADFAWPCLHPSAPMRTRDRPFLQVWSATFRYHKRLHLRLAAGSVTSNGFAESIEVEQAANRSSQWHRNDFKTASKCNRIGFRKNLAGIEAAPKNNQSESPTHTTFSQPSYQPQRCSACIMCLCLFARCVRDARFENVKTQLNATWRYGHATLVHLTFMPPSCLPRCSIRNT